MGKVELVDEQDVGPLEGGDTGGAAPHERPHRRRALLWTAGVVAVVVAVAGMTQVVLVSRERAAAEAFAKVPGVLPPVGPSLTIQLHLPPSDSAAVFGTAGGSLAIGGDGSQTYTRITENGYGWTTQVSAPTAALAGLSPTDMLSESSCQLDGDALHPAARVVCLVSDGGVVLADGDADSWTLTTTKREVVVMGAADGAVLARWPVERGVSLAVMPDDLVVIGTGSEAGSTVIGCDVLTGVIRWTHTEGSPGGTDDASVSVFPAGDVLALVTPTSGVVLLQPHDGSVVRELPTGEAGALWNWYDQPGSVLSMQEPTGTGGTRTTFIAPDGDPAGDTTVQGSPVHVVVDDGSVPGLLLSGDSMTHGWRAGTDHELWSVNVLQPSSAVVMRGRVYLTSSLGVFAFDGVTGKQLWKAPATDLAPRQAMTDGRHLLVPFESASSSLPVLVAFDPVSGREDFRVRYPPGVSGLSQAHGWMVANEDATGDVVVLG